MVKWKFQVHDLLFSCWGSLFFVFIRPSIKKMLPNTRKRVTVSARARISVRKRWKATTQWDVSYLDKVNNKKPVSILNAVDQTPCTSVQSHNDAIMIILQEINECNVALVWRMDKVEQTSVRDAAPFNP